MSLSNILLIPGVGGGFALDSLTVGLESAWSVGRRLLTSYTGPIIRVRRSSDSTEQDFSSVNGVVSVAAVQTFCGAGDGFLTTIYGQSGLIRNLVQTTAANQPCVCKSGVAVTENGRLAAEWTGASATPRHMFVASSTATYKFMHDGTASTAYSVQRVGADTVTKMIFGNLNAGTDVGFRIDATASETLSILVRGTSPDVPVTVTKTGALAFDVISYFIDANNATAADRESAWLDGTLMATDNASTAAVSSANATRNFTVGGTTSNTVNFLGNICELVLWSQDLTAQRTVWETSARTFWGTP